MEREHKELAEAIDEIKNVIEYDRAQALQTCLRVKRVTEFERARALQTYLQDFHRKTKSHFQFEEEVMQRYGYPYFGDHKAQHDDLISSLEGAINGGLHQEPVRDLLAVMTHLTRELQHCISADQHLKVFLAGQ